MVLWRWYSESYWVSGVGILMGIPMTWTSHYLFSWRAPSRMIVGVLITTLTFHISSSVKYAYSTHYDFFFFLLLCKIKKSNFIFQWFSLNFIFYGLVSIILISDIFILQNFGTEQCGPNFSRKICCNFKLRTCKHKSTYNLSDNFFFFFFQNGQNNNMDGDGLLTLIIIIYLVKVQ